MLQDQEMVVRRFYERQFSRAKADIENPLADYCERVYFVSESKGRGRKRKAPKEVELVKILPSGRCHLIRDIPTNGLDNLAEEIFGRVPPEYTPYQYFLEWFAKLPGG